ncbi:hypothetical protein [Hubei virga-like virus 12]|uniref:hypothetical protein n=1 Tax=Hubei virga-like virus 12 TaxID=1923327 RepID=UPI00090B0030|nr:hypothetical protein [Hubei virga-like virus 12]APG77681.1 hypothetical protein [Hubei virga-like virus 12]
MNEDQDIVNIDDLLIGGGHEDTRTLRFVKNLETTVKSFKYKLLKRQFGHETFKDLVEDDVDDGMELIEDITKQLLIDNKVKETDKRIICNNLKKISKKFYNCYQSFIMKIHNKLEYNDRNFNSTYNTTFDFFKFAAYLIYNDMKYRGSENAHVTTKIKFNYQDKPNTYTSHMINYKTEYKPNKPVVKHEEIIKNTKDLFRNEISLTNNIIQNKLQEEDSEDTDDDISESSGFIDDDNITSTASVELSISPIDESDVEIDEIEDMEENTVNTTTLEMEENSVLSSNIEILDNKKIRDELNFVFFSNTMNLYTTLETSSIPNYQLVFSNDIKCKNYTKLNIENLYYDKDYKKLYYDVDITNFNKFLDMLSIIIDDIINKYGNINSLFKLPYNPFYDYQRLLILSRNIINKHELINIAIIIPNESKVNTLKQHLNYLLPQTPSKHKDYSSFLSRDELIKKEINDYTVALVSENNMNYKILNAMNESALKYKITKLVITNNCANIYTMYNTGSTVIGCTIPGNEKYTFVKNTKIDNPHMYGYDGKALVEYNFKTERYETNSNTILISKQTKLIQDQKIYNNIEEYLKTELYIPIIYYVNGVAGCGKTQNIISNFDINDDFIISTTKANTEELIERISKHYKIKKEIIISRVKTIDSVLINKPRQNIKKLFIDEIFMVHAGTIMFAIQILKPKYVLALGDTKQIPYIERLALIPNNYSSIIDISVKLENLNVSSRCPADVVEIFKNDYKDSGGFYTTNGRTRSVRIQNFISKDNLKSLIDEETMVICFKEADAEELILYGIDAYTIHKKQGTTKKKVILVRLSVKPNEEIFKKREQILVALTRHTEQFIYYTKLTSDDVCKCINKVNNTPLTTIMKNIVTQDKIKKLQLPACMSEKLNELKGGANENFWKRASKKIRKKK